MRRQLDRNLMLGILLLTVIVLSNAYLSYRNTLAVYNDAQWVAHTQEVLASFGNLRANLREAEAVQRTYLVTGNDKELNSYREAKEESRAMLAQVSELTHDNASQQNRVSELTTTISRGFAQLDRTIELRQQSGVDAARQEILGEASQTLFNTMDRELAHLVDEEQQLLRQRKAATDQMLSRALLFGGLSVLFGLLAIAAFVWLLMRSQHKSRVAAAAVYEQREWFRTTLASIGDAVIATDINANVTFLNTVAEKLVGWRDGKAIGQPLTDVFNIVNESTRKPVANPALRALEEGVVVGLANHTVLISLDGTERPIDDSAAPIRDEIGRVRGSILVFRDISSRKKAENELRAAEHRNEMVRQASGVGFWYCDLPFDVLIWDERVKEHFWLPPDATVTIETFYEQIHPDDREPTRQAIQRSIQTHSHYDVHYRTVHPQTQQEKWVRAIGTTIYDDNGVPIRFDGITLDVTSQRLAADALSASERLLREFADTAPAMLWATEADGSCTFLSRGWYEFTGQTEAEGLGFGWLEAVHPDDREAAKAEFLKANQNKVPFALEHRLRRADGVNRWVIDSGRPRFSSGGVFIGYIGSVIDITERRVGEEALRQSEEQYRTLFNSVDQGFCIVDIIYDADGSPKDYRFLQANPAFETQTGLVGVVGRRVKELVPDLEAHWAERYARVAETGESVRFCEESVAWGRWFDVYATRVADGSHHRIAILFTDVTERKKADLERETLHREVEAERARLAETFDLSPAFKAILRGPQHIIDRVNSHYLDLVGHRPVVGRPIREALPELEGQGFFELLDQVYKSGLPFEGHDTPVMLKKAGSDVLEERYVDFVYQPLRNPEGNVTGVLVHGIDLTDRKRAEKAVREKDERLKLLVDHSRDYAVVITNREGLIIDWAGGAENITGFCLSDVLGKPIHKFFSPEDQAKGVPEREMETAATVGRAEDKRWHSRKDGSEFFADGVMVPLRDEDGKLHGFGKVFRDATDRKRSEDAVRFLADASASLAELVDYESTLQRISNLAVAGFADWCVVDIVGITGDRRRLAVTKSESDYISQARAEDAEVHSSRETYGVVPHVLRTGEPRVVYDINAIDPDTDPLGANRISKLKRWGVISFLCVPLISRGVVIGSITFLSTSSRRRFGDEQLRVAQDLAERVAVAMENARLYRELQEQDRRKDEFLAILAHELRNPLAPVRTGLHLLRNNRLDKEAAQRTLGIMDRQMLHLVHLVDDLMDVSRVSSGKILLRKENIQVREIIEAAVETNGAAINSAGHQLEVIIPDEPLPLEADRTRLVQVVANLLSNAAKYTPNNGRITVAVTREGNEAVIRVQDTGIGIPGEMLPKVFEIFTQVGTSLDRAHGGLGLGLTLVKRLVEMHGGRVAAESAGPGSGSTFIIRLPLITAESQMLANTPSAATANTSHLEILVVDDNRDSADSLSMLLQIKGHSVKTAYDGPDALRMLETFRPHLILLDLGLPGMSGYEVARRIRESAGLKGIFIAALTGWGQEEDRRRTKEAGFDYHLVKPADPAAVEEILGYVSK